MRRLLLSALLGLSILPPAEAAVTSNQLMTLVETGAASGAGIPFRQRVKFNLVLTCEQVCAESAGTARHAERARLASQILNNPDNYLTPVSLAVVAQLTLASTSLVTVSGVANADVDTTDAAIASAISSVFNDFLPQP